MLPYHSAGRNASANSGTPIYLYERFIGYVNGRTFRKTITGSKHLLQRPRAICFDRCTLRDAAAAGATCAVIVDRETGATYSATFETIETHSFPVHRGHGDQVGVSIAYWSVDGETPEAEYRAAQTNKEREGMQLNLFGDMG